jgi:hypothetical protein
MTRVERSPGSAGVVTTIASSGEEAGPTSQRLIKFRGYSRTWPSEDHEVRVTSLAKVEPSPAPR